MRNIGLWIIALALVQTSWSGTARAAHSPVHPGSWMVTAQGTFSTSGGDLYEVGDTWKTRLNMKTTMSRFVLPGLFVGAQVRLSLISQSGSYTYHAVGPQVGYVINAAKARDRFKSTALFYLRSAFLLSNDENPVGHKENGRVFEFGSGIWYTIGQSAAASVEVAYELESVGDVSGRTIAIYAGFTIFFWK